MDELINKLQYNWGRLNEWITELKKIMQKMKKKYEKIIIFINNINE